MLTLFKHRFPRLSTDNRSLLMHSAMAFGVRIVGALAAFVMSLISARVMGAEQSGYYFLGLTMVMFLAAVSRVGLDNTVLRFTGAALPDHNWGDIRTVIQKALFLAGCVGSMVALGLWAASGWLAFSVFDKPQMARVFQLMAPGIIGLSLLTLIAMSLQGLRRVVSSVFIVNICVNLLLICALLVLGINNAEAAAGAYSVATFMTLALGGLLWWRGGGHSTVSTISWNELFKSCMPLWVVMLMAELIQWSGQFIAGAWLDASSVAFLSVAQRTAMLTSFVLIAVNLIVAPRFAALYKQGNKAGVQRLAINSVRLMAVVAFPIIIVMLAFPSFIMGLFGPEFRQAGLLLQILALGQFVNVVTGSVGYLLMMSGHEKDMRNVMLLCGPLAVVLALILTPMYGAVGSAIATAIALASQNLLAVWMVKKRLGFNTLAVWKRA
ncbi:polysaccharide biosynthesis C-terminal domain-containing protein [Motiliproteus sp. SC1-56]|uniref:oligosaccharide flippase family protein n=1 Tax=Motiliproteus sp. SC1-56 TaxID=2799565 RepID=UPI001A8D78EC|nr:polysaccharide biosynthesis C-terminal domain-containing protein [Motiliproteus sp. SC1-56]